MNEQQQRIAIAESLGLIKIYARREDPGCGGKYLYAWEILEGVAEGTFATVDRLMKHTPDYLNDLNAMRQALSTMSNDEAERYESVLLDVLVDHETHEFTWFAEAHYHAEAYLRTKGLWQAEGM